MDDASQLRARRGEELRALVVSWNDQKTFSEALEHQTKEIAEGKFKPNDDWCVMADEILGGYMSQPRMTAWDDAEEKKDGEA